MIGGSSDEAKQKLAAAEEGLVEEGRKMKKYIKHIFDILTTKLHHMTDTEHIDFKTFFDKLVSGQGHQMFPFNVF